LALGALYRQNLATKNKIKKGESKGCYRWALAKETDKKMASTVALQVQITGKTTGFPHLVLLHLTLFALRVGFAGGVAYKKNTPKKAKRRRWLSLGLSLSLGQWALVLRLG